MPTKRNHAKSPETRAKISAALKNRKRQEFTLEWRSNMSEANEKRDESKWEERFAKLMNPAYYDGTPHEKRWRALVGK